ncbi:hypothetical protein Q8W13_07925 [Photobacterium damselae subsp. piscicida]|nr:hypothetical protein [Photobacterium damselae subsp. piscicida]
MNIVMHKLSKKTETFFHYWSELFITFLLFAQIDWKLTNELIVLSSAMYGGNIASTVKESSLATKLTQKDA